MKKLLIMCGTGIATSTVVTGKVKEWLKDNNLDDKVSLHQSKISDELGRIDDYDVIISTTLVPENVKEKVIDGVPLLTGMGIDEMYDKVLQKLNS
ncbi:MAG: PTS sugar transporter subunit IIB [Bacillota bacterium]|uniref:PTS sugar transporter subunit IIB n=2 Tax=Virgibacillus TaxID=84406 RepID=A0A941DXP8_9BACI|nr:MULTISPECIES: PTS sugar transporter subunit IIB [Virgibacillus]NAZ10163.1 PTS galactitol transporter subunit IIB [Agaribacter marinus]MBR7797452.1 PTS sugar transporter subunit IIB [Virgibacillus salarius]MDY7042719.1 PTS sugar transporter subunit IIB [Virgibacillus sp. M23]QRZ17169.1 PTS sugar transporter subunit IIB [Virgibacillus sp. AGTR]WBX79408.1 PTS sugar transporter subunit IIB [Virgibacillus salarius]